MDIHKPKPVHGWREFAGEVSIIVLGVLIALVAEQAVQALEWRHKVDVAESAMRDELASDDGPEIYQRGVMHPCVTKQLDAIRTAVMASAPRAEVVRLVEGYKLEFLSFDSVAHANAASSDVAAHMPTAQLALFTNAYSMMPTLDRTNAQEARDIAKLHALRTQGGALSDSERDRLLEAVETLRGDEELMWAAARWTLPEIRDLGVPFDVTRMRRFIGWARDAYGPCIHDLPDSFWSQTKALHGGRPLTTTSTSRR